MPGARPPSSPFLSDDALARELASHLERPVVLITVGSDLRGDDAFGLEVARALASGGGVPGNEVLEGGVAPENVAERAARSLPRTVLLVDAVRFGGAPGELRLLAPEDLAGGQAGTHAPSLELLATYLRQRCGARVLLLGCEPAGTGLGGAVSPEVCEAAERAAGIIRCGAGKEG